MFKYIASVAVKLYESIRYTKAQQMLRAVIQCKTIGELKLAAPINALATQTDPGGYLFWKSFEKYIQDLTKRNVFDFARMNILFGTIPSPYPKSVLYANVFVVISGTLIDTGIVVIADVTQYCAVLKLREDICYEFNLHSPDAPVQEEDYANMKRVLA